MVNHGALCGVQKRGIRSDREGADEPVSATVPLSHRGVRQAPGGGRGAHVVRRSWWVCGWADRRAGTAVAAG
ncbi:hypothetical protein OQI_10955 [Streptomyces pharetrae CZA14]|uniref:Uncharacterized protein n=1 Tax=Streptomyces pharetrae CZA14 TaxID=1144883 RepID=A0ABX3YKF7_9ACTN|nr:hypothetical protein OQI_10955 [Streptomyces pharetrae CZA14]